MFSIKHLFIDILNAALKRPADKSTRVKPIIFRSAEAVTSLLGSLKIAGSLGARHYHSCPWWLSARRLSPANFYPPSSASSDFLFLHSLQDAVFCHCFDYSGRWEQMFVRNDQSINQREEKACRAGVRCICLNPALFFFVCLFLPGEEACR